MTSTLIRPQERAIYGRQCTELTASANGKPSRCPYSAMPDADWCYFHEKRAVGLFEKPLSPKLSAKEEERAKLMREAATWDIDPSFFDLSHGVGHKTPDSHTRAPVLSESTNRGGG